jgi:hypothetical protein
MRTVLSNSYPVAGNVLINASTAPEEERNLKNRTYRQRVTTVGGGFVAVCKTIKMILISNIRSGVSSCAKLKMPFLSQVTNRVAVYNTR